MGAPDPSRTPDQPTEHPTGQSLPEGENSHPPEGPDGQQLSEFANPDVEVPQEVRRYPSTLGGLLFLVALAAAFVGLVLAGSGRWLLGSWWIGGALLGAAACRVALPEAQAGMLHVRRRLVDVPLMAGLGLAILLVASSVGR